MDRRDIAAAAGQWWTRMDQHRKQVTIEVVDEDGMVEVLVPVTFDVCCTCHGCGVVVNPDIDRHGLSREDFAEDPDFAEDYFSGVYNITCPECCGRNVVPKPDYSRMNTDSARLVDKYLRDRQRSIREQVNDWEHGY